ncbi:MAG: hypothetical protein OEU33_14210 [Chromatiales bacterium]|jgi:hypothetical protein|nr:hypothetical protein [Chromatiales bacterium]
MSVKAAWIAAVLALAAAPALADEDPNTVDVDFLEFLGSWERGDAETFQEIWDREIQDSESQTGKADRHDKEKDVERPDDQA